MKGRTNAGGGGVSGGLDFVVVGGTKSPEKAAENTVWINTDVEITDYVFTATEPASPVAGMVWIELADGGGYKIAAPVDGNYINLYLGAVNQYVGGEWVEKEAAIYQSGAWVELSNAWELFNEVDGFASGYSGSGTDSNSAAEVLTDSVGKYLLFPSGGGYNRMSYVEPAVDLTEYNTLEIYGHTTAQVTSLKRYFGVWAAEPTSSDTPVANVDMIDTLSSYTMDISALSGKYYLGTQYSTCATKVYRLILS